MRTADNVEILELETVLANGPGTIYPLLVWDDDHCVLFDAGLPGMGDTIRKAAISAGVPYDRLNTILITHADMDHIGSLAQIIRDSETDVTVTAHRLEKPYIVCDVPPVRLRQMEERLTFMTGGPAEQLRTITDQLRQNYTVFKSAVHHTMEDGEKLPICGGITGIFTPGHTPGHMCYYIEPLKLLVAGDILQVTDGALTVCPDFTVLDKAALELSLIKLSRYDIDTVVCYHGGIFYRDVSRKIEALAVNHQG